MSEFIELTARYPLCAPSGFFGLKELNAFIQTALEPSLEDAKRVGLVLDFSRVDSWDIAALLWLSVGLHHYRSERGLAFRLRLPQSQQDLPTETNSSLNRSADYLRRWRFDQALLNIDSDIDSLLVPEQHGYFVGGPREFYRHGTRSDERGVVHELLSRSLAQIRNLIGSAAGGRPNLDLITESVKDFQSQRIGDILVTKCRLPKRTADLFSDHLLTEALWNVQEHPRATIGFIAISPLGRIPRLVVSVVDNGDPIPKTIYKRYQTEKASERVSTDTYKSELLSASEKAAITHYATLPGKSSKIGDHCGYGLTYIKEDTIDAFRGDVIIVSDGVSLKYSGRAANEPTFETSPCPWRGNLIRLSLPIS